MKWMKVEQTAPSKEGTVVLVSALLWFLTLATFLPALRNDFVNYDDPLYVTSNPHVQSGLSSEAFRWAFLSSHASNWHPVTWLSHMLDWQLFGARSWGHHLSSALLHSCNAVLLFLLWRRLTGAFWPALAVAILFGVHPLRVQSVAWVAERKDVLSGFFFLVALLAYTAYVQHKVSQAGESLGDGTQQPGVGSASAAAGASRCGSKFLCYGLALFSFALALMSKAMVVSLPVILLLLDYWPLRRLSPPQVQFLPVTMRVGQLVWSQRLWRLVLEKVPFFLLAAAVGIVTILVQQSGGAIRSLARFPVWVRLEGALVSYSAYLGKFFYPVPLAAFYPHPGSWKAGVVLGCLGLLVAIFLAAVVWRRKFPYLLAGWLWYIAMLLPVIGLVQAGGQFIADRYTYLPLIGLCIMLVFGARDLGRHYKYHRFVFAAAGAAIALACMLVSWWQIGFWADSETLFRRALAVTPDNALARLNLGVALGEKHKPGAVEQLQAALRLVPGDPDLQRTVGNAFLAIGHPEEAIAPLAESLALEPQRADAHLLLGRALEATGDLDEALGQYREAARLNPHLADARADLGVALFRKAQFQESAAEFREVLKSRPASAEAHDNLGLALAALGQGDEAMSQYRQALKLRPNSADVHNHAGLLLRQQRRLDEAILEFQKALQIDPKNVDAQVNWGVVLYNKGLTDEAIGHFEQALRLDPTHAQARKNLEALLARKSGTGNK